MKTVTLAKVKRAASVRAADPTGLRVQKINGCLCSDLVKGKKKRRKLRGSLKAYLDWLDNKVPAFADQIHEFMQGEAKRIAAAAAKQHGLSKAARIKGTPEPLWEVLFGVLNDALVEAFKENATSAFMDIGVRETPDMTGLLDERALEYADERAAELVGMRRSKRGKLIENPNPKFAISDTTRTGMQEIISNAVEEGWSTDDLATEIMDSWEFSRSRAETIARTELAFAHSHGNMAGWQESGEVDRKQSILGSEHDMDDMCDENAEAGPIGIDDDFPSGHFGPPYHPNCVCDMIPILREE